MTITITETAAGHAREGRIAAIFAETNRGVEAAVGSFDQERATAVDAEERARAWRAILLGNLL